MGDDGLQIIGPPFYGQCASLLGMNGLQGLQEAAFGNQRSVHPARFNLGEHVVFELDRNRYSFHFTDHAPC